MTRSELIRRMVLNAICGDCENVDQRILPDIARDCAKLGFAEPFFIELHGMPALDLIEEDFETYFYPTKEGTDFHLSDDTWWPFDDDGEPLPNWQLDEQPTPGSLCVGPTGVCATRSSALT